MPPSGAQELRTLQKHEILEIEFSVKSVQAKRKTEEAKEKLSLQST